MKLPFANYVKAHHISRAALGVGVLVAAIVFFVVGASIRLLMGPVSLGPFAGTLAAAIQGAMPGISLKYDQAAIEWSRDEGRVNLVVLGARIFDENGHVVVQAPKADIDLAARPFLDGRLVVQRITLVGVQLGLVHMKQGGIRLGLETDKGGGDILARLSDVIDAKGSTTSSLKSFAVRDAHLQVFDETTGVSLVAPHASLVLSARTGALGAVFDADVTISGRQAHVKANLALPLQRGPISGDATVTGLNLQALAANAAMFRFLGNIALTVNLASHFTVAPGAHLTAADFDLTAAGAIPVSAMKQKTLHVRQLRLNGHYDGNARHLTLASASLNAKEAQLHFTGAGDFHEDPQGALESISGQVLARRVALDLPGVLAQAVGLQSVQMEGVYQVAPRRFDVKRFAVAAPALSLNASGSVTLGDKGQAPGFALNGQLAALPIRTLLHYWPLPVAAGTRRWIDGNVFAGTMGPLTFETHIAPGDLDHLPLADNALALNFSVNNVEGSYVKGLTHLTGVSGTALLSGDTFTADFNTAMIGPLVVSHGHALIPTLHQHGTIGQFSAHVDGKMTDIMHLIDMPPLGYPTRFGVDPDKTGGEAGVDLTVTVPMLHGLSVDAVGIAVKAAVNDFSVTLGKNTRLTHGTVLFDIDNEHLHQTGTVMLADAKLAVDWREDFKTTAPITTNLNVKGPLTPAARAALNIGLGDILTGTIPMTADIQGHRGQLRTADAAIDLTGAAITVPILHLGKPAGLAASGDVLVNFAPGNTIANETIRLGGPHVSANGTANFDKDGHLQLLSFPSVKMGPLNDLSFTLNRGAAGDDYMLRGRSLDGSFIGRKDGAEVPGAAITNAPRDDNMTGPFHINARLDRLAMRDGVSIAPFDLDLSGVGERPGALTLSGALTLDGTSGKPAPISGTIENPAGNRKLTIQAANAGLLIRGLFAFESLRGGQLKLVATLPGGAADTAPAPAGPDYQGTLNIDDFSVVHQPFLTRLFAAGSLTGIADLMGGDGISIENLEVPFSSRNDVISVHDARARGRAIGATADGYIDRPKDLLALKGSLVPAYGLNSVLGVVPILGDILVSKKGEGVFGVTYSAKGNADQPDISVNPLSVLTPGILRRVFEGPMPTAANAPSNNVANNPVKPAPKPQ